MPGRKVFRQGEFLRVSSGCFAGSGERDGLHADDSAGHRVLWQDIPAERIEFGVCHARCVEERDFFAQSVIGNGCNAESAGNSFSELLLHFLCLHLDAARVDDVVEASPDAEAPVRADFGNIVGREDLFADTGRVNDERALSGEVYRDAGHGRVPVRGVLAVHFP